MKSEPIKGVERVVTKQNPAFALLDKVINNWLLAKGARLQYAFGGILLISQVIVIVVDSGSRLFGLASPFMGGANEVVELQMGLLAAVILGNTWFLEGHVRIELLRDKMSRRSQELLDVFSAICGLLYCVAVCWGVWGNALDAFAMGARTDSLQIPIAPFLFIFTAAFIHFSLILLASAIRNAHDMFVTPR